MLARRIAARVLPALVFAIAVVAAPISPTTFGVSTAVAVDTTPSKSVRTPSSLTQARKLIDRRDYSGALASLEAAKTQAPDNADVFNLLGFANRKLGRFDVAMVNYQKALRLDRNHRGAHEYIGELYLQKSDLASAKKHLAALDRICTFGCDEYYDLKKAVQAFAASKVRPDNPAPAASAPANSQPPNCGDVGGYEAYMKATGKTCAL